MLGTAVRKAQQHDSQLTSIHSDLLQVKLKICLVKIYKPCESIIYVLFVLCIFRFIEAMAGILGVLFSLTLLLEIIMCLFPATVVPNTLRCSFFMIHIQLKYTISNIKYLLFCALYK